MEHSKHVFRVALLLTIGIVTYVLGRSFLIPKSYGMYGDYRFDNVAEQRDKPLVHGSPDACLGCHKPQAEKRAGGKHATVPCEDCHAPLSTHASAGKKIAPMVIDRSYTLCVRCHMKMVSRPTGVIAQVVPEDHVTKQGEKLTGQVCIGCHDSHSPKMGDEKAPSDGGTNGGSK